MKTLGINYHPTEDHFRFLVKLNQENNWPTKRSLLSDTSKIFDPLGWLAPVIIKAKIFFQELWILKLDWDEKLPTETAERWKTFRSTFSSLQEIIIPRWIGSFKQSSLVELHGFSDASETAYAAVIYARVTNGQDINTFLICSKTRVAPIKTVTIPRLELCGAVLLAALLKNTGESMSITKNHVYAWCDSTIVLGWIQGQPSKYKTFVANRLVEIHSNTDVTRWKYIKSSENPADCASRGIDPPELANHPLWWNGPVWLNKPESTWPSRYESTEVNNDIEIKTIATHMTLILDDRLDLLSRFSCINKLLRVTSLCFKFIKRTKASMKEIKTKSQKVIKVNVNTLLSAQDLLNAQLFWIHYAQEVEYNEELQRLKKGLPICKRSMILSLNTFI